MFNKKLSTFLLLLLCMFLLTCCAKNDEKIINTENSNPEENYQYEENQQYEENYQYTEHETKNEELLTVHFIDVGQADAALLVCDNHAMLIDGGNVADSQLIYTYLEKQGIEYLDYIIATHAHEDHMGGLSAALVKAKVGAIYMPSVGSDSEFYLNFLEKAYEKGIKIQHPISGESVQLGLASVEFFIPKNDFGKDINNSSIVTKIIYQNTSFLFTGDAEEEEEHDILNQGYNLKADVLKVGHHGADTSSSDEFLHAVNPKYAVISVGENNAYGQPSENVLSRLGDMGVSVYRTDLQGDIVIQTDGSSISVSANKNHSDDKKGKSKEKSDELSEIKHVADEYILKLKEKNTYITSVDYEISDTQFFSDYAFIICNISYSKGTSREGILILQKNDGWKALEMEFE